MNQRLQNSLFLLSSDPAEKSTMEAVKSLLEKMGVSVMSISTATPVMISDAWSQIVCVACPPPSGGIRKDTEVVVISRPEEPAYVEHPELNGLSLQKDLVLDEVCNFLSKAMQPIEWH